MKRLRLVIALAISVFSLSANADILRCEGQIIEEGDSRVRVLENCGEPDYDEGAKWYYKKSDDVMTVLHFAADKVTYIEDERI